MERRIALVAALSLTVLVGSILLVSAAGLPSGGEQAAGQNVAATSVADLTATGTPDASLDGRDGDDLPDDGFDDDGDWSGESADDGRERGGSAHSDDRHEEEYEGEWSDDD